MTATRAEAALLAALPPPLPSNLLSMASFAESRYAKAGPEPSLGELLADPIMHLIFARDHLLACEVRVLLEQLRGAMLGHPSPCLAA